MVVGEYLFLKIDQSLEYLHLNYEDPKASDKYGTVLNLEVDQDVKIKRLITTEIPHLVQIVFKKQNENG